MNCAIATLEARVQACSARRRHSAKLARHPWCLPSLQRRDTTRLFLVASMQARRGLVAACSAIGRLPSSQHLRRSGALARRWMTSKPQPSAAKASTSAPKAAAEAATAEAGGKAAAKAEAAVSEASVRLGGSSRGVSGGSIEDACPNVLRTARPACCLVVPGVA